MSAELVSSALSQVYEPWTVHIDLAALAALMSGALLGLAVSAVLYGCQCCGKRLIVEWRWCYTAHFSDSPTHPPRPAALRPAGVRRAVPQRAVPTSAGVGEARAWNDLRDALGPEASDATLAELLEAHGDDLQAAAEAFYATPRWRAAPARSDPVHQNRAQPRGGYNA